ncbi:MAG: hypothetical protein QOE80_3576 [Actinomycetota bacterium]|nr:hypothetical protein [Actinomycetota bacterium]
MKAATKPATTIIGGMASKLPSGRTHPRRPRFIQTSGRARTFSSGPMKIPNTAGIRTKNATASAGGGDFAQGVSSPTG